MNHSERLRILQVVPNLEQGGAERTVVDLVRWLDRSRVESAVCILQDTVPGDFSAELKRLNVPIYALKARRGPKPGVVVGLVEVIRNFRPHVVHSHLNALKYAWFPALFLRVPLVHTLHALPGREPWVDRMTNRMLFLSRNIMWVAVSHTAYRILLTSKLMDSKRLRVILNGVDLERFRSIQARTDLRLRHLLPKESFIGISVGALRPEKNFSLLIAAAARVIQQVPSALFLICGDGPQKRALENEVARHGLGDKIRLLGNRNDIPELLSLSDVFVSSSSTESFGLSIVEAMAAGLPVVATRVGAVPEVVGKSAAAILVSPGDSKALAEAIVGLIHDPSRLSKMGFATRAHAQAFDIMKTAQSYQELYIELMKKR